MQTPVNGRRLHFGLFEADLAARTLSKRGIPIHIQEKPFQILEMLLARRGEVVTRDELRKELWPAQTFVEFDEGVNTAIGKLRYALGDSAERPAFVETVRGKGYRFIATIAADDVERAAALQSTATTFTTIHQSGFRVDVEAPGTRPLKVLVPAVFLLLAVVGGGIFFRRSRAESKLTEKDTIVLADFTNSTGDPVFDDTLREALATQLQQSPFLSIVSDQSVRDTLRLMGHSSAERLNAVMAQDLCQRVRSKAVVLGSIAALGSQYVVVLNAVNCITGDSLAREEAQAARKEDVLKALDAASVRLRSKVGESLTSIQKFGTPIERATTPSLEALRAYSLGRRAMNDEDIGAPIPWLREAVRLDPGFAMAYADLGAAYSNLGEAELGSVNTRKAYELSQNVSQWEQLYIESHYYDIGLRDYERARQVYELQTRIFPRDCGPWQNLGWYYMYFGQYQKALEMYREARRIDPSNGLVLSGMLLDYLALNRVQEAQQVAADALARKLDSAVRGQPLYLLAFLRNDEAGMKEELSWARNNPGNEDWLLSFESDTEAYHGRMGRARDLSRQAVIAARKANEKEVAATWQVNAALREAELGNWSEALRGAKAVCALSRGRAIQQMGALVFARTGDFPRAQTMLTEMLKTYPDDSFLNSYWQPTIEAAVELQRRNPAKAIEVLRAAAPYELGITAPTYLSATLYPVYLRGEAYMALRQPKNAAAEFQKILDHRGAIKNFPLGVLALMQLGRADAMAGDKTGAKKAYAAFFDLWKDADLEVPVLKQARMEYAKLQ